jgi:hypothetical protein
VPGNAEYFRNGLKIRMLHAILMAPAPGFDEERNATARSDEEPCRRRGTRRFFGEVTRAEGAATIYKNPGAGETNESISFFQREA